MFRVLAALLFSAFTFATVQAEQWYLSPGETDNLGIAVAELPLSVSIVDYASARPNTAAVAPALLPEDEALVMVVAAIVADGEITTGSIAPQAVPSFAAEPMFVALELWAVSREEHEARLTP